MTDWPNDLARVHLEPGEGDPVVRSRLGVPDLHDFGDIARLCGCTRTALASLLLGPRRHNQYRTFSVPKRTGGVRLLSAPSDELKLYQGRVLRRILARMTPSRAATAFRPGHSIVDNARAHANAEIVIRMDLKDFFFSVKFPRLVEMFEEFGYGPGIAGVLALLVTEPGPATERRFRLHSAELLARRLPQGAPTSPAMANLVCHRLDARMLGLVAGYRPWRYTRYADDMFFSWHTPRTSIGPLLRTVELIARSEGFRLNHRKTIVMRAPQRLLVTGLLVDGEDVRLPRDYKRRFRALLHSVETRGYDAASERLRRDARAVISGHLAYVSMVEPRLLSQLRDRHPWLPARPLGEFVDMA